MMASQTSEDPSLRAAQTTPAVVSGGRTLTETILLANVSAPLAKALPMMGPKTGQEGSGRESTAAYAPREWTPRRRW